MNKTCKEYIEDGNPWDLFIIWKNSEGNYIEKYNKCGSSNTLTVKKWKTDPFNILDSNTTEIDTTRLKYPLSFNRQDSTWFETGINFYKYYDLSFPSYDLKDMQLKGYVFRELKRDDDILASIDKEFQRNQYRFEYNNMTAIKQLLDCLILAINKHDKKLKMNNTHSK